jgi:hypothetical protein
MNFAKWLEFSDMGGEVSYNHMNNVVAGDFNIPSKWMAQDKKQDKNIKININKLFGKKKNSNSK